MTRVGLLAFGFGAKACRLDAVLSRDRWTAGLVSNSFCCILLQVVELEHFDFLIPFLIPFLIHQKQTMAASDDP